MAVFNSGPVNIESGNSANFVVEFLSSNSITVTPSTTNFTISYTNTSNAVQTDTVLLSAVNSFFTGTWPSTSAALGLATWQVTATGSTLVQASGQIRVIQRQASS